jgi:hypothetical protein
MNLVNHYKNKTSISIDLPELDAGPEEQINKTPLSHAGEGQG